MFGIIYIITNDFNSKVYIGQTKRTLEERWKEHKREKCSINEHNMLIKRAILKYGEQHFKLKELERCAIEDLNAREIYYISLYDSYKNGYNLTRGGQEGTKDLKLKDKQTEIVELYKEGFSLRELAKEYNVDKFTIRHILEINNISLRKTKTYKYSQEERKLIIDDSKIMPRKDVMKKWNISVSYLSQLINGKRRI